MDTNLINEVFVAQLEELNNEADKGGDNNWLSPTFINEYELKLKRSIKKARTFSTINSLVQLPLIIFIFMNRHAATLFGLENKYWLPLLIVVIVLFNFAAAKPQRLLSNYEKQLLLIDTYRKIMPAVK